MPERTNIHSKLLNETARYTLAPMGLIQKGRSRIWLDDHGWWIGVVEFQPSGFSKGSGLNFGCMWLWHVFAHIGYAEVDRVGQFQSFETVDQFRPVAEDLARQAAQVVLRNRSLFPSIRDVCQYYLLKANGLEYWQCFDAAVACGLSGKPKQARQFFSKVVNGDDRDIEWVRNARSDAEQLAALTYFPEKFELSILERVRRTRDLQGLAPVSNLSFSIFNPENL
jgi:hypothetical protein